MADAGPLIVLSKLGELALLPRVFRSVCITQMVHAELLSGGSFPGPEALEKALADWLRVEQVDMGDGARSTRMSMGSFALDCCSARTSLSDR